MAKLYTFNRPLAALWLLPLAFLSTMLLYGIFTELNVIAILMVLVSLFIFGLLLYFGFLRRLRIGEEKAEWITPKQRHQMDFEEVKHFGIIKYRSFRFIFFSRLEEQPFSEPGSPVAAGEDTFLIQYRPAAWQLLKSTIQRHHQHLKPLDLKRN